MKGPESEIPGITRVTVAPATHTSQAAGHRHQSESRQKQIPRGKQNRQKNHARQRGQHPSGKSQQLVAPGRTSPIQRFGKCRRHAPRTIRGGVTTKIRSRHSDFGYTRHLCSLHNLKGNANDSKVWRLGNRSTLDVLHTPGFDAPNRDWAFPLSDRHLLVITNRFSKLGFIGNQVLNKI